MKAVIQRVDGAAVEVGGQVIGAFTGPGLMVLVGVSVDDEISKCALLADKIWKLRIFERETLTNRGVISQFTLYADTSKGRRPTWLQAARGDVAEPLVNEVVRALRDLGAKVETGKFGADMRITQTCDGPMTVLVEV